MTEQVIVDIIDAANKAGVVMTGLRTHIAILKPQRVRLLDLFQAFIDGEISTAEARAAVARETLIV